MRAQGPGRWGATGLLLALSAWSPAFGQVPPSPSTSTGLPTRQQVQPPTPGENAPPPSTASVDARNAFAQSNCPLETSTVRVTLDHVRFTAPGTAKLPPRITDLLAGIVPDTKGEQPIRAVCALRDRANAALRRAGYIASVQIPPQEITTGELVLTVITARITEVRVRGEAGRYRAAIAARIRQIQALDPLNEREAERILLLTGDIPGLDVQLSLRPAGTAPGDVIGDLAITTRRFAILANVQNYGSKQIGPGTTYVRGEYYGLLGLQDIAYLGASTTFDFREQRVAQLGYIAGLGNHGTTLGGRFTYAWSRPTLGSLDLRSQSIIGGFDLTHPLVRSVRANLTAIAGAELIEQRTRIYGSGGSTPLNRDKLRVVFGRLSANYRQRRADGSDIATFAGNVEVRKGLGVLGASERGLISGNGYTLSRFDGDPQAFVARGDLDAVLHVSLFSAAASLRGQWANHALLNFEEFAIGNLTLGRGYDPGANSGDRMFGTRFEGRMAIPLFRRLPIELFGFRDEVKLRNLDAATTEAHRRLRSYGGGARVTLPGRLLLEAMYARPQDKALSFSQNLPPARVLLSLTAQFAPTAR